MPCTTSTIQYKTCCINLIVFDGNFVSLFDVCFQLEGRVQYRNYNIRNTNPAEWKERRAQLLSPPCLRNPTLKRYPITENDPVLHLQTTQILTFDRAARHTNKRLCSCAWCLRHSLLLVVETLLLRVNLLYVVESSVLEHRKKTLSVPRLPAAVKNKSKITALLPSMFRLVSPIKKKALDSFLNDLKGSG